MAHTSYSPYPSVDSASDYTPEPAQTPSTTKRRARGSMTAEERREARAHRNRLAAQCSRDRKKAQFEALTTRVTQLEEENRSLRLGLVQQQPQPTLSSSATNAELVKENQELRGRIQQLELAWQNMTKILGAMSIPLPPSFNAEVESQRQPVLSRTSNDTITSMPLSPAPTASPKSEPVEEPNVSSTEPTCELARFANVSPVEASLQRVAPSARSLVARLLSEQTQWEKPRPRLRPPARCSPRLPPVDAGMSVACC